MSKGQGENYAEDKNQSRCCKALQKDRQWRLQM